MRSVEGVRRIRKATMHEKMAFQRFVEHSIRSRLETVEEKVSDLFGPGPATLAPGLPAIDSTHGLITQRAARRGPHDNQAANRLLDFVTGVGCVPLHQRPCPLRFSESLGREDACAVTSSKDPASVSDQAECSERTEFAAAILAGRRSVDHKPECPFHNRLVAGIKLALLHAAQAPGE